MRLGPKGQRRAVRRRERAHKPKGFRARFPGQCVALDTIERFRDGVRRYIITLTDLDSRFAFALATTSHASRAAAEFFILAQTAFPLPIHTILTDNGCEFARHFAQALAEQALYHWHTYPHTPKMNAHVERFNRTLQEEFIDYHEALLFADLLAFNDTLFDYLLWFNAERPHFALDQHPPIRRLIQSTPQQCNMYWPHTCTCKFREPVLKLRGIVRSSKHDQQPDFHPRYHRPDSRLLCNFRAPDLACPQRSAQAGAQPGITCGDARTDDG